MQNASSKCVVLALRLSVRQFKMPLEGLSFVKTLGSFGIIYVTDPLLQNMTKIICLRWLTFDIFINSVRPCWISCANFVKIRVVYDTLYLWNENGDPNLFARKKSLSNCSKNWKNSVDWKIFAQTSLTINANFHDYFMVKRWQVICFTSLEVLRFYSNIFWKWNSVFFISA